MRLSGLLALALVGIIMGIASMSYWHRRTPMHDKVSDEQPAQQTAHFPPTQSPATLSRPRVLRDLLRDRHWSATAAVAVESLTANVWNTSPREFITLEPTIVELLASLANHEGTMPLLERHPELAPLLASSSEPGRLAAILSPLDDHELALVEGMFKQYPWEPDAGQLMVVLESRDTRKLLIDLIEKKFLGAERLLMCPLNSSGRRQYLNWVTDILKRQIASSQSPDQHRFSLYSCLMSEAPGIRERMKRDPEFCREFSSTLWKRFVDLAGPDRWDVYAGMPGLWTLLRDPCGVDLIKKYLHLPFVLYEKYSKAEEWAVVRQALLNGDDALLMSAIFLCRDDELFHEFLVRKDITGKTRRNILAVLVFGNQPNSSGSESSGGASNMESKAEAERRHELLLYVRNIKTAEAVDKEFGARKETDIPVIGNIVILGEKAATGRKRSWSDWGAAGMDAVCIGLTFVSPPGTSKAAAVALDIGKNVADTARDALGEYAKSQFLAELHDSILANRNHQGLAVEEKVRQPYFLSITLWKAKLPTLRGSPPQVVLFMPLVKLLAEQSKVGADSMRLLADWDVSFTLREGGYLFVWAGDKYRQGLPAGLSGSLSASAVEKTAGRERDPDKLRRAWQLNAYAWWSAFLKHKYR